MDIYRKLAGLHNMFSTVLDVSPATKKQKPDMSDSFRLCTAVAKRMGLRSDKQLYDYCRKETKRLNLKQLEVVKAGDNDQKIIQKPIVWKLRMRKIIFACCQEEEYKNLPPKELRKLVKLYMKNDFEAMRSDNFGYQYGFNMRVSIKESFRKVRALSGGFLYSLDDILDLGQLVCQFVMSANKGEILKNSFYSIDWTQDYLDNEKYQKLSHAVVKLFNDECSFDKMLPVFNDLDSLDLSVDSNAFNALYVILNPYVRAMAHDSIHGATLQTPVLAGAFFLTGLIDKNLEYIHEPYKLHPDQQEAIMAILKNHF